MENIDLSTYAGRLAHAMRKSGKTNQSELAREVSAISPTKVTPQTIQHLVSVGKGSTHNAKLAKVLGVNVLWLETGQGEMLDRGGRELGDRRVEYGDGIAEAKVFAVVPLISWVTAGRFCEAIDNFEVGDAEMYLPCPVACGPHTYALRVTGDSMTSPHPNEKSYPDGVFIFVDPDKEYGNGSKVIAKVPAPVNQVTFKQLVMDVGRVFLRPLNPVYPTVEIVDELHVCGVIIGSFSFG